jgi:ATP-dependent DNA helicase RecG
MIFRLETREMATETLIKQLRDAITDCPQSPVDELLINPDWGKVIPKILKKMAANGSPAPLFETDDDRLSFVIRLPLHPLALVPPGDSPQVTPQVGMLLSRIEGEMTRQAIQDALGLADREHFRKTYLAPALEQDVIEMTLPDKPNSRSQRYRLTALGQRWLAAQPGDDKS